MTVKFWILTGDHGRSWSNGSAVVVEDDGPGIEAAVASEIFKPFVTTKGRGEGAGLGLAVSSSIAREVGGELSLAPGVLGGACFALRLPVFEEERDELLAFAS